MNHRKGTYGLQEHAADSRSYLIAGWPSGQDNGGGQSSYAGAMEDAEVLARPGTKDGQTKIIKEQGAAVAYTWDQSRCCSSALHIHCAPQQSIVTHSNMRDSSMQKPVDGKVSMLLDDHGLRPAR